MESFSFVPTAFSVVFRTQKAPFYDFLKINKAPIQNFHHFQVAFTPSVKRYFRVLIRTAILDSRTPDSVRFSSFSA